MTLAGRREIFMTTAQAQAARTKLFALIAALLLAGCAPSADSVYRIDGAATDFCVPGAVDATPARPNQRKVVQGGFALNGCWNGERENCVGKKNVLSLSVSDKASSPGRRFGDLPADAHLRLAAIQGRGMATHLSSEIIAIPDSVGANKLFLWNVSNAEQTAMVDDDTLEVTCTKSPEVGGYICNRTQAADDYLLGYSFASQQLPTTFKTLDSSVQGEIEKLRCPRTR